MAGADIPYHLRIKKFVERKIFNELLGLLFNVYNPENYSYISMGGPFLADHHLLSKSFELKKLISIEKDKNIVSRQEFNQKTNIVECLNLDSSELVSSFTSIAYDLGGAENCIAWLDFADAKHRHSQITEFGSILPQLSSGDIIKITLNCSISTLSGYARSGCPANEQQILMKADLNEILGNLCDVSIIDGANLTNISMAQYLLQALEKKCLESSDAYSNTFFLPISKLLYNDGHHEMLTVTCIALKDEEEDVLKREADLENWEYFSPDWTSITKISFPDLSIKERTEIERLIATGIPPHEINEQIEFQLEKNVGESIKSLQEYNQFRNFIPYIAFADSIPLPKEVEDHLLIVA